MKKISTLFALLLAAGASQAQVYVSGALGTSHANGDCTGVSSCDNTDTGSKFFAGYDFGNGFGAEIGYLNFGKFTVKDSVNGVNLVGKLKPAGLALGGVFTLPLSQQWSMPVRLGVARIKTVVDASGTQGNTTFSTSVSETKTSTYAGLGVAYAFTPSAKVELGLDSTKASIDGEKGTVRMFTLGVSYKF